MTDPLDMTDEELRSARAAWEAERPSRWARVAALRGSAYAAAYDEYMTAKAQADVVAEEARRRGVRRRHGGVADATSTAAPSDFRFDVSTTLGRATAVADGAVRYPERARTALRISSARRSPGSRSRPARSCAERSPASCRATRRRTSRTASCSTSDCRNAVCFEDSRSSMTGSALPDGRAATPRSQRGGPFDFWRPGERLAGWDDIALDHGLSAAAIWWALRRERARTLVGPTTPVPPTLLKASVASPRPLTLSQLKAIADGAVAAAQWTTRVDPVGADRFSGNLVRAGIDVDRDEVVELLGDSAGAGAGHCGDGLIANDGRVDPDDHLLVAGAITVELIEATRTSLSAGLFSARPMALG